MTITIRIPGTPVGKGRPRFARRGAFVQTYTPEKTQNYEALVKMVALEAMEGNPPIDGPVRIDLWLSVLPPASWNNKKAMLALTGEMAPTTKPDVDNTLKCVLDACNGIVWIDDKQVVDAVIRKRYGATPQAVLVVDRWNPE